MEILRYAEPRFAEQVRKLVRRRPFDAEIDQAVAGILTDVRARGDAAVVACARRFDRVELTPEEFRVTAAEFAAAGQELSAAQKTAIRVACRHIQVYARAQKRRDWLFSPRPGVRLGERFVPLTRVGVYVPGGTAPLVSTVLHTVTLAKVAGVREIVVVTPPGTDKRVHPAILYAAKCAGATELLRLGGVYAIGALAYGTASISPVEKIVGPGNAYVTAAKRQVYGEVALDLVAGPSEILIIGDASTDPRFVAADMLSQAEHGSGREQAVFITTAVASIAAVQRELQAQSRTLGRSECVKKVLENGVFLILAKSLEQAAAIASDYAPEHLEIMTRQPARVARKITAAGAIFLGPWTPEPIGDFVAGPSHVLPTGGAARYFSGLTLEHFYRRMSVVQYSRRALQTDTPYVLSFAAMEGLDAHGRSAAIRFEARRPIGAARRRKGAVTR